VGINFPRRAAVDAETKRDKQGGKNMKPQVDTPLEPQGPGPEKRFRAGAISAAVWRNEGKSQTGEPTEYRTISFERRYKDKTDQWQTSHSLRMNDLPKAALVLTKAYEFLALAGEEA
jgi:hypothetical protein